MNKSIDLISKRLAAKGVPMEVEHRFAPPRRFRFDFAWPKIKMAIEQEGGVWVQGGGGHNRGKAFLDDMEKYNIATKMGWRVFRFTPGQIANGEAYLFLEDLL